MSAMENVVPINSKPDGATPAGRRTLLANGFEPIPVLAAMKKPLIKGWTKGPVTDERLTVWETEHPDHKSTGCRTGKVAMFDNDLGDPDHAAAISDAVQMVLGISTFVRIGAKPSGALAYYNSDPISKITITCRAPGANKNDKPQRVEFFGIGGQMVTYGIHPDRRAPYEWPEFDLFDTKLEDLPEVDPDMIRDAVKKVMATLTERGFTDVKVSGAGLNVRLSSKASEGLTPVTSKMLVGMFETEGVGRNCDINEWIGWMCVWKYTPLVHADTGEPDEEFDRFGAFDEWSASGDRGKYEDNCLTHWLSKGESDSRSDGKTIASLVYEATANGYTGPTYLHPHVVPDTPAIERLRGIAKVAESGTGSRESDTPEGNGSNPSGVRGASRLEWFAPVAALNERFAIVTGGKHAGRIADLSKPREPHFLDGTRFHSIYRDAKVIPPGAEAKPVPISKLWEGWRGRRKVTGVEFTPPPNVPTKGAHNLWQGFAVDPKEGDAHKPLLRHLYKYVCRSDGDLYRWLISWLANIVQEPGRKPGVAIALLGDQGAGKTILYRYLAAMYGTHAARVSSPSQIVGNFNAHMAGLIVLGVEEGFWAANKQAESVLKNLITAEDILMEQKGVDPIKINNHVHIMVTSNASWVVPVSAGDRRWCVFHVDPARKHDRTYWKEIYDALEGDGPANLLKYLQGYEYDHAILFRPPMTQAKAEQAAESMDSVPQWWLDILRGDRDPAAGRLTSNEDAVRPDGIFEVDTLKETVWRDYKAWADDNRHLRALSSIAFWREFRKVAGPGLKLHRPTLQDAKGGRQRVAWFAPRDICRKHFAAIYGCDWVDLEGE